MNKITKIIGIASIVMSTNLFASSVSITGEINITQPKLAFEVAETPVAHVNEALIKIKQLNDSGCTLVQKEELSGKTSISGDVNCLIVFETIPAGMVEENGLAIRGYPENSGKQDIVIKTFFHNSTLATPILIREDSYTVDILEPIPPVFSKIDSKWGSTWAEGDTMAHDRDVNQTKIKATVEPRNYEQRIEVSDLGSCVVDRESSLCEFSGGIGAMIDKTITGENISGITVSSLNRYYNDEASTMNNMWDFRPPVIANISIRADSDVLLSSDAIKSVYGHTPNNEEALIVLESPHINMADSEYFGSDKDWYFPTLDKVQISLTAVDKSLVPLDMEPIILNAEIANKHSDNLEYRLDISDIGDGRYIPTILSEDRVGNKSLSKTFELTYLDRNPPVIEIKQRKGPIVNGNDHYFLSDIVFRSTDGLDEKPTWDTVTVGDLEVEFMESDEFAGWNRVIEPETGIVKPNQELTFSAKAYDQSLNLGTDYRTFQYMPIDFELRNSVEKVYKNVSYNELILRQISGKRCRVSEEESEALASSVYDVFTCVPDYYEIATNLTSQFFGSNSYLKGYVDSLGLNDINYNLYSYTIHGDKVLIAEQSQTIEAFEAPAPVLSLAVPSYTPFIADSYIIGKDGGHLGRVLVSSVGSTIVAVSSTEPEARTFSKVVNGIADKTGSAKSTVSVYAAPGELWSKEIITFDAYYENEPELISTIEIPIIKGPPVNDIRVESYGELREVINTEEYSVTVKVGYSESYVQEPYYDPTEIGEWVVYLAEITSEGFVPMTEKFPAQTEGVKFDIDLESTYNISLVPIAELISPIEGFEETISGRKIRTRVLNGNPVEGELTVSRLEDVVPFTTSIKYTPASREDRDAVGILTWYYSDDNQETWKLLEEYTDKAYISMQIENEGKHFIKAEVINKYTQAKSETAVLEIIGFSKPDFIIDGPSSLFEGETAILTPKLVNSDIKKEVIYRISTDGGETFETKDSVEISGKLNDRFEIHVHARYSDAPADNRQSWVKERHYVKVKNFRQPRAYLSGPFRVETGKEYTYNIRLSPPYYGMKAKTIGVVTLPNGDEIEASTSGSFQYTAQQEDIQNGFIYIKFNAWVEGFKADTELVKSVRFRAWDYAWPDFRSSVRQPFAFAPSNVDVTISPYGILVRNIEDLTYEWTIPEGITKVDVDGHLATLRVDIAGKHEVLTKITDARGHETNLVTIIETLEASPYAVEFSAYEPDFMREPLDINLKASISGGHPLDRIASYSWFLDGEEISSGRTYASLDGLLAGTHKVDFILKTSFGVEHKETYEIVVNENILPTCGFSSREYSRYVYFTAECEDPDGRISDYKWIVNGEEIGISQRFFFKPDPEIVKNDIQLIVIDDSGGKVELTVE